jgi:hypothetical protein
MPVPKHSSVVKVCLLVAYELDKTELESLFGNLTIILFQFFRIPWSMNFFPE